MKITRFTLELSSAKIGQTTSNNLSNRTKELKRGEETFASVLDIEQETAGSSCYAQKAARVLFPMCVVTYLRKLTSGN